MEKESIKVLNECKELQNKKGNDYQNPNSSVKQADYYPSGIKTIQEILHAKKLRLRSLIEAIEFNPSLEPNFESIEDTLKDIINYASFGVSYCRGKIDGQNPEYDILNRPIQ